MSKTTWEELDELIRQSVNTSNGIDANVGDVDETSFSAGITTPTVLGHLKALYYHLHDAAKVWPTGADANHGADPITITSSDAEAWLHGDKTEVIAANSITTKFDLHWIIISAISANDDYELKIYKGTEGNETVIGRIAFCRNDAFSQEGNKPLQVAPQSANTRISASLACGDGDGASVNIKFYYHAYPDIT